MYTIEEIKHGEGADITLFIFIRNIERDKVKIYDRK